jgi:hypothetical protein
MCPEQPCVRVPDVASGRRVDSPYPVLDWSGRSVRPRRPDQGGPALIIEVAADAARQGHGWRHPLRFMRPRNDMTADDLKEIGSIKQ